MSVLRPNEFRLRQRTNKVPARLHESVRKLLKDGASKKALCALFGCDYAELKRVRDCSQ